MKNRMIAALLGTALLTGSLVTGYAAGQPGAGTAGTTTAATTATTAEASTTDASQTTAEQTTTAQTDDSQTEDGQVSASKKGKTDANSSATEQANGGQGGPGQGNNGGQWNGGPSQGNNAGGQWNGGPGESSSVTPSSDAASVGNATDPLLSADDYFSDRDLEQAADTSNAKQIAVSDGQDVEITEAGVYVISGTASDVTIKVNADDEAKVQLVLDGLNITNTDKPAIRVLVADKVFITTAEGSENSLSVTGTFAEDEESNVDAVIFAKSDVTLNGEGTLTINCSEANGISGKDDLVITGGTYVIKAGNNGIEAHDSVSISGGDITIDSGATGIRSKDKDDDTVGSVLITGGTFTINAGNDGIHGTTVMQIDGGTFDITAVEGLESTIIQINGGTISISASDDGINASQKSSAYSMPVIIFNGGDTTITMGQGDTDAVDANGSIYVNDGTIDITAQMSSFDYDQEGQINGGTVTVNGETITEMPADMMGGGRGGMGDMRGGMNGQMGQAPDGSTDGSTDGNFQGRGGMRGGPMGQNGNGQNGPMGQAPDSQNAGDQSTDDQGTEAPSDGTDSNKQSGAI